MNFNRPELSEELDSAAFGILGRHYRSREDPSANSEQRALVDADERANGRESLLVARVRFVHAYIERLVSQRRQRHHRGESAGNRTRRSNTRGFVLAATRCDAMQTILASSSVPSSRRGVSK